VQPSEALALTVLERDVFVEVVNSKVK